jgi:hypothetical protein
MVCGIFAVLLLVSSMAFAQEKTEGGKKNAVTLDLMTLVRGFIASDSDAHTGFFCVSAAYERLVAPHFTIGGELDLYPGKVYDEGYFYFGLVGGGRYYPMSEYMEKFFIGASMGISSQAVDGSSAARDGGFFGLRIGLRAGYKVMFGKVFFMEPSMAYTYEEIGIPAPLHHGWQGGLRMGISF